MRIQSKKNGKAVRYSNPKYNDNSELLRHSFAFEFATANRFTNAIPKKFTLVNPCVLIGYLEIQEKCLIFQN